MNCAQVQPLLPAYHDDQLPCEDRTFVGAHLVVCVRCAAELEEIKTMARFVQTHLSEECAARIVHTQEHTRGITQVVRWVARYLKSSFPGLWRYLNKDVFYGLQATGRDDSGTLDESVITLINRHGGNIWFDDTIEVEGTEWFSSVVVFSIPRWRVLGMLMAYRWALRRLRFLLFRISGFDVHAAKGRPPYVLGLDLEAPDRPGIQAQVCQVIRGLNQNCSPHQQDQGRGAMESLSRGPTKMRVKLLEIKSRVHAQDESARVFRLLVLFRSWLPCEWTELAMEKGFAASQLPREWRKELFSVPDPSEESATGQVTTR